MYLVVTVRYNDDERLISVTDVQAPIADVMHTEYEIGKTCVHVYWVGGVPRGSTRNRADIAILNHVQGRKQ